jgi:hypothetical protein
MRLDNAPITMPAIAPPDSPTPVDEVGDGVGEGAGEEVDAIVELAPKGSLIASAPGENK